MRLLLVLFPVVLWSQSPLRIEQVVARALERYPAVKAAAAQTTAAEQQINLARTAYLPRADFLAQVNRATRNNVFGMLLPQSTISPISGPPLHENDMTSVWGSAIGFLVSWEPFDFGLRQAQVDAAAAGRERARLVQERTAFEVASASADSFVTLLAAQATIRGAQSAVERAKTLETLVAAQVRAELRPGVDQKRIEAERAAAEVQLVQCEQAAEVARAALARYLDLPPKEVQASPGPLLNLPAESVLAQGDLSRHPAAREQSLAIDETRARQKVIDKSYAPRFNAQASSYARGTGANPDFTTLGGANGLGPNIYNWGVGLTVTFPAMALPGLRVQKEIEANRGRAEEQSYQQLLTDLRSRLAQARFEGAQRVAKLMPAQLAAARESETQATARYRAGLGTLVEVADAQRVRTQAEIDDSLARLAVWRAMLGVSTALGDLEPFLKAAAKD